jgi:uncharacterized membrane protein
MKFWKHPEYVQECLNINNNRNFGFQVASIFSKTESFHHYQEISKEKIIDYYHHHHHHYHHCYYYYMLTIYQVVFRIILIVLFVFTEEAWGRVRFPEGLWGIAKEEEKWKVGRMTKGEDDEKQTCSTWILRSRLRKRLLFVS